MKNTNVVHLGRVRDLLAEWNLVREALVAGRVTDFSVTLRGGGKETIYVGGLYKEDSAEAARVALRMSMARMFMEDQPLPNMKHGT